MLLVHIFVKNGLIYIQPRPKWLLAHCTHIVEYISPAEKLHYCDICNYPGWPHDSAVTRPCTYLFLM